MAPPSNPDALPASEAAAKRRPASSPRDSQGRRLVLRADGSATIGLGHVTRLLALADILQGRFAEVVFAVRAPSEALRHLLTAANLPLCELLEQPLPAEARWLSQHFLRPDDVVVLDGYGFDFDYQTALRTEGRRLVCLDDLHTFPFAADLVLNPAGGVAEGDYDLRQPRARLLAGPAFAPLRAPFWARDDQPLLIAGAAAPEDSTSPTTVLLCLGGADPRQLTRQSAARLLSLHESAVARVHVVVGAAYAEWETLRNWAAGQGRLSLHRALSAAALAGLMRQCGAAVLSPSTVSYEYCAVGGGLLFTLPTADNQRDLDQFLRGQGLALPYSSAPAVLTSPDAPALAAQLRRAQALHFDGLAPTRLRQAFAALLVPPLPFRLRRVVAADSELLLAWANEPAVRAQSFSPAPIPRAAHEAWLRARLADDSALLLLAEDALTREPAGLIRFQVEGPAATLSYQLAPAWRGRGLAALLLLAGTDAALAHFVQVRQVRGQVRADNLASVRAFERAGFGREENETAAALDERLTFVWVV